MPDREYDIRVRVQLEMDETAKQKIAQAVTGSIQPLQSLGKAQDDVNARFQKAIAGLNAEEAALGRNSRTLQQQVNLRREWIRALGATGQPISPQLVQEAEKFQQMQGRTFSILGQEISVGRVIAWGIAWTLAYRALNAVTGLITGLTIGALRTLAEFQQRQISLAAELVNIDPARPFDQAMRAAGGLLDTLLRLQPAFIGTQQRFQEILVGTQRYGIAVDLVTETGQREFLAFANAIALVTAGIDRQGQGLQEIRSLAEGVVRPGSQLLQVLKAIDPQITQHIRLWRAEGTVVENVVRLLPGYEQAVDRVGNTLQGQINRLGAEYQRFLRMLGEQEVGPVLAVIRALADELERIRRIESGEIPGRLHIALDEARRQARIERETRRREEERGQTLRGIRSLAEGPQGPFTLDELQRMFERRRTLREFTPGNELRALSEILIPRAEAELEEARKEAEAFQDARGDEDESTKRALTEVHRLERELVRLEGQRVSLAEDLGQQYRRQAEMLERATEAVLEANARVREAAAGAGLQGAGLLESVFRGQLGGGGRGAAEIQQIFGQIRQQQESTFRQRRALLDAAERDVRGIGGLSERERAERLARIAQERIRLLFDEAEAQSRLNREEREAVTGSRERDLDAELNFLRQKLALLQAVGDEQAAQNVRIQIEKAETRRGTRAELAGLSPQQIQRLIDQSVNAVLSGQLSFEEDQRIRARIEALRGRLAELREGQAAEAGDVEQARRAVADAAQIFQEILGPALETIRSDAASVVDAILKRTEELRQDIVNAWATMGSAAGRAFQKAFEDELGRIPGVFNTPQQPSLPIPGGRGQGGTTIIVNGLDISTRVSDATVRDLVAAVVGSVGDAAAAREHRMTGTEVVA